MTYIRLHCCSGSDLTFSDPVGWLIAPEHRVSAHAPVGDHPQASAASPLPGDLRILVRLFSCDEGFAMDTADLVTVYNFWTFGNTAESRALSTSKAPRDVIVGALRAEVVPGTGQAVLRSELDRHGHYRRIATGWGELE